MSQALDFLDRFDTSRPARFATAADAIQHLHDLNREFGFEHTVYLGSNIPPPSGQDIAIYTTYSSAWVQRYILMQYERLDPVILIGRTRLFPLDWSEIDKTAPKVREFFGEAAEFGVAKQGLTIPVRGAFGERALFSVNCSTSDFEWNLRRRELVRDLHLIAYDFHERVLDMLGVIDLSSLPLLAPREIEALRWAAEGKTNWEIASILGVTENTVRFYLVLACQKLHADNRAHAVAKAIRTGLI